LYSEEAIHHQIAEIAVEGRGAIRDTFRREFVTAEMVCIAENIFEDGEWALLESRDPKGLARVRLLSCRRRPDRFQRGYWDKLSFLRMHGLPLPTE
jgi:hypothetical protein